MVAGGIEGRPKTLRRYVQRWRSQGAQPGHEEGHWHRYDDRADCYTIQAGQWRFDAVPGAEVRDWCAAYTYQGSGVNQAEVARRAYEKTGRELTRAQVGAIMRALGVNKTSLPIAPHDVDDEDQAVELVREAKEASVELKVRAREAKDWRSLYEKERKASLKVRAMGEEIARQVAATPVETLPVVERDDTLEPMDLIVCLADWHVGACFETPVNSYSATEFRRRVVRLRMDLDDHVRATRRPIRSLHFVVLGDMVDGVLPMRAQHHTEQDLVEGEQVAVCSSALADLIGGLEVATGLRPQVHSVSGNHDRAGGDRRSDPGRIIGQWLAQVTEARLGGRVDWHHERGVVCPVQVGSTLLVLTHGDRAPKDLAQLVRGYRQPSLRHYVVVSGHRHSLDLKSAGTDTTVLVVPSLMGATPFSVDQLGAIDRPGQALIEVRARGPRAIGLLP